MISPEIYLLPVEYEIFESIKGKKKRFFVVPFGAYHTKDIEPVAKRFFKVSADNLRFDAGWTIGDDLWLNPADCPDIDHALSVLVITSKRRRN